MIATPLSSEFIKDPDLTYYVLLAEVALLSMSLGVMQSSTFGLGGILPGKYMGAIFLGNGYAAISSNLLRAICLLTIPESKRFLSAMIFFMISAGVMVFTAIVHV